MSEWVSWPGLSPAEWVAVTGSAVLAVARWLPVRARRPVAIGAAAVVVVSLVWATLTGPRWLWAPIAVGALAAAAHAAGAVLGRRRRVPRWLAIAGTVAVVGAVAVGPGAAWAFPVPAFPEPSGPHAVGTTVFEWTDQRRPETATDDPADRRAVVAQLWYPAESRDGGRAPYLGRTAAESAVVAEALARYAGLPGFALDGLPRARTASVPDARPATGARFPVVLFSPGLGGVRTQNTLWAEELASRGYAVLGLDHPYDSAAVVRADGTVVRTVVAATGDDAEDRRRALGWTTVRAEDLSFALTGLTDLDLGTGPFAGLLDTGRAAVTGHSLGGGAALLAAQRDHRFAAAVDIDGFPYSAGPVPYPQPALALHHPLAPGESPDFPARLDEVLGLSGAGGHTLEVPGTAHLTFTDAPLWLPPLPGLVGDRGRLDGPVTTARITALFLDHALRGRGTAADLRRDLAGFGALNQH